MLFSYQVSEADYLRAWKMRMKIGSRGKIVKTIMFWVFILVCLMMLWAVVTRNSEKRSEDVAPAVTQSDQPSEPPAQSQPKTTLSILQNVGPFVFILGLWAFLLFKAVPMSVLRMYRKDPAMQGVFTIDVTPASLSIQNTAGISSQAGWSLYDCWKEGKDVIVLLNKSGTYFVISLGQLSETQREELRGMLASVLPQK